MAFVGKIIWTVDPYQNDLAPLRRDGKLLASWFGKSHGGFIEPVFVLTPAVWMLPSYYFDEELPHLKRAAKSKLSTFYTGLEKYGISRPTLLTQGSDHVEYIVQTLLRYAAKRHATLIVARTHARSGFPRMVIGSVAETLLLRSSIPLLLLNPHPPNHTRLGDHKKILFPTELDRGSEKALDQILSIAQDLGATVDLVHAISRPRSEIKKVLRMEQIPSEQDLASRKTRANHLKARASQKSVTLRTHLLNTDLSTSAFIIEQAKRLHPILIAMEAKTGEFRALFAGSATRQVVRAAPCPVWAIHRHPKRY